MLNLSKKLKMSVLAGLAAATLAGGFATPASARQSYTDCDRYRCYRVVCNDYGNHCRRTNSWRNDRYYRDRDWDRGYNRGSQRYVCDRWGRDCGWVVVDRNGGYRDRNGVYLRLDLGR